MVLVGKIDEYVEKQASPTQTPLQISASLTWITWERRWKTPKSKESNNRIKRINPTHNQIVDCAVSGASSDDNAFEGVWDRASSASGVLESEDEIGTGEDDGEGIPAVPARASLRRSIARGHSSIWEI